MSLLSQIIDTSQEERPRRVLLYGTHGIGKSTFGACAPDPIFIRTEDGLGKIKTNAFPLAQSMPEVFQATAELYTQPHGFRSVVVDSADWMERLIWRHVCQEGGKESIADFGFGKGYATAASLFGVFLDELAKCGTEAGMLVILLAHCQIERFENPQTDSYDRYTPKLHKSINGLLQEWCDEVLFCNYKVFTKETDEGFNKTRNRAIGGGDRVIYTSEKPSHLAKKRLAELPDEIPLSFADYWHYAQHDLGKRNPHTMKAEPTLEEQAAQKF